MKQLNLITAILTLAATAACSSTPNFGPERTDPTDQNQTASNPADQTLEAQAICTGRCEYRITDIGVSQTPTTKMTKLNGVGDVYGVLGIRQPTRYRNGAVSPLPVPADIDGSRTQPGETDFYNSTSNEYGDYMISKVISNPNTGTYRHHTWFHRQGSPENAFSYKGNFSGVAMSNNGHNLSDRLDNQFVIAPDAQVPHLIWNVNQNTDTPTTNPAIQANGSLQAINDLGVAVGTTRRFAGEPISWNNGAVTGLGSLDPTGTSAGVAHDININGEIVGESNVANQPRAFRYAKEKMYPIDALDCARSTATAISDSGIIGMNGSSCSGQNANTNFAMIHKNGITRKLNTLVPSNSGLRIEQVVDINSAGQILVLARRALFQDQYASYLRLDPANLNSGAPESFLDNDGLQVTSIFFGNDDAYAMAVQPNDKIILAGSSQNGIDNPDNLDFALVRYNENGSRDNTFGSGVGANTGIVTTRVSNVNDQIRAIALQSDGRIVVGGSTGRLGANSFEDFVLARYNTNGTLDSSFDNDGIVITNLATIDGYTTRDRILAIAIQSNGKIVAAGYSTICDCTAIARYNTNGSLDTSFSDDGKFSQAFGASGDQANAVSIQNDGKIVIAGYMSIGGGTSEFSLARLNTNGTLDTSFGTNGSVRSNLVPQGSSAALGLKIQSDGRILAAGRAGANAAIVRYNTNGTFDTSFDTDGILITTTPGRFTSVDTQSNGQIITSSVNRGASDDMSNVHRFNTNGTPDTNFGTNGSSRITWNGSDTIRAIGIQSNNDILIAGSSTVPLANSLGRTTDFALARLNR
jgi:uncharacterized delta-60 repeat protein